MDWLTQYWLYLVVAVGVVVLVVRLVVILLPKYREPVRHSGERTIRVVGVGGAGGNAVDHMIRAKQRGVDYVAVNTDAQVLEDSLAPRRVQIGAQLTQGLGAGGDATIGRQAAEEDAEEIAQTVAGADLVFVAAGLGGGTGSGAAPVIAAQARRAGALTVGVVTRPFEFEGIGRRKIADAAWVELKANVDTLLVIENERVVDLVGEETSMLEAFTVVNEVLAGTVRAIVDIMTVPGLINLDFADVRAIMQDGGMATAGIGAAVGPDRAVSAAQAAVTNPLLNHDLAGAGAILLNVAGASGMTMSEVKRAAEVVRSAADPEAMIIFGTIFDDHLDDELRVTVIATRLRGDFAYVHRAAADTQSIAAADEPTPAAAVAVAAASAVAVEPEEEAEEADEEAPRWAAIPIVTSDEEPVPVVAYGATATAELDNVPEPFAPWAASQAYAARVEEAPAEESVAPAEQTWSAPAEEAEAAEPETAPAEPEPAPAEQSLSAPAEEAEAPEPEPAAAATGLAATVFAQSEADETISELEPAEEPAPTEPTLTARPYEALGSERWAATTGLAATVFAQSEPDQPVSELEQAEESAPAEQPWSASATEAEAAEPEPEPTSTDQSWLAPAEHDEAVGPTLAEQPRSASADESGEPELAPEPAPVGQSWFAPADEAEVQEPEPAQPAWSTEPDDAAEPAPTDQPWLASAEEVPESEPTTGAAWAATNEEAHEPDGAPEPETGATAAVIAPAEPEVSAQEPEADDAAPEPEPWAAFDETSPAEPVAEEPDLEPSAATPVAESAQPAEPPWYDPGDEALEAARSAAAPAIAPSDEPASEAEPSPPPGYPAPPGKVVVSGRAAPRAPEPPPSQLARRTTQAVLTGVWKRLQKPPEPPR